MIKTLTFAIMHFAVAFTITYLITGDIIIGGLIALIEPAVNTVAYYFHEKIWLRIKQNKEIKTMQGKMGDEAYSSI